MNILITGSTRGIGKYLANKLVLDGFDVFGSFNNTSPEGDIAYPISHVDITEEKQVQAWIQDLAKKSAEGLALINCAGINYNAMIHKSDTANWENVIKTNLIGSYLLLKHILPIMRENKFGRIILFSSVVPLIGVPGTSAYSASKSALWGLVKATAAENAKLGITINTINLGYFDIGMINDVPRTVFDDLIHLIPSGKLGNPEDIFRAVRFLLETDYITGSQINLNGGLY